MTFTEYRAKWFPNTEEDHIEKIMEAFDILYLEFTPIQAVEMLSEYLNNADEIYNDKNENVLPEEEK